jgi:hypothetical protein
MSGILTPEETPPGGEELPTLPELELDNAEPVVLTADLVDVVVRGIQTEMVLRVNKAISAGDKEQYEAFTFQVLMPESIVEDVIPKLQMGLDRGIALHFANTGMNGSSVLHAGGSDISGMALLTVEQEWFPPDPRCLLSSDSQ